MRRILIMALAGAALGLSSPAFATLHGFCSLANPCTDNGVNTPTSVNPPTFGFTASPGGAASGQLMIDILLPNNSPAPGPFTISGALSGTATLFSATAWTSGDLAAYLGISASPTNPIGAYLPTTLTYQPSATGFWVFTANLGNTTLLANSNVGQPGQDAFLLTLNHTVTAGSYVVGFLNQGDLGIQATANSGAILETSRPVAEPATWGMMLLGFAGVGMAIRRSRRRGGALMQVA